MEEHRAGYEILGRGTREVRRIRWALRERFVSCGLHKTREPFVRDLIAIYPETIHANLVNWLLLEIEVFGTHAERPVGYPNHAGMA
jgi:hypothetical protein